MDEGGEKSGLQSAYGYNRGDIARKLCGWFLSGVSSQMLHEVLPVVRAYGASPEVDPASILELGQKMGDVKTSMLQDLQRGQQLELATICDAVLELAKAKGISMPVFTQSATSPNTGTHANKKPLARLQR